MDTHEIEERSQALEPMLHDPDVRVRKSAVVALGSMKGRTSCELLSQSLADADEGVRVLACQALARVCDAHCLPAIHIAAHDESPQVRAGALWVFASLAVHASLDDAQREHLFAPIVTLAFDPDDGVRSDAAAVLGTLDDVRIFEPLAVLVEDEVARVRASACASLGLRADERACGLLLPLICDDTQEPLVLVAALEALGHLAERHAIASADESQVCQAVLAFACIDVDNATRTPREVEPSMSDVRATAVWSLGRVVSADSKYTQRAIALLESLTSDDTDEWTRNYAIESRARITTLSV